MTNYERIYAAVRQVPAGRVATYGQIAAMAGLHRHARQVGYALAALRGSDASIPWHRIINAKGEISLRKTPGFDELQRVLLEDEGVNFDSKGRVSLARFQWRPDFTPAAPHCG